MSIKLDPTTAPSQPTHYQIRVQGHLGPEWADWFEGLTITPDEDGDTLLTGPVADQAALYGLLRKVRNLGKPLLSVNCVEPDPTAISEIYPSPHPPTISSPDSEKPL